MHWKFNLRYRWHSKNLADERSEILSFVMTDTIHDDCFFEKSLEEKTIILYIILVQNFVSLNLISYAKKYHKKFELYRNIIYIFFFLHLISRITEKFCSQSWRYWVLEHWHPSVFWCFLWFSSNIALIHVRLTRNTPTEGIPFRYYTFRVKNQPS